MCEKHPQYHWDNEGYQRGQKLGAAGSSVVSTNSDFSLRCLRRAKDFDHLKVGQSGRGVHGKDELGKEPEPEGGRSKAR